MLSRVCVRSRASGVRAARGISYVAPVRDISFVLYDVLKADETYKARGLSVDRDVVDGLISECARFSEQVLAPLNVVGDREGGKFFSAPSQPQRRCQARPRDQHCDRAERLQGKSFVLGRCQFSAAILQEAYAQYAAAGWQGLSVPEEWGGQGLPLSLGMIKAEMMGAANWAWSMYPGLSVGAMNTLLLHGSKEQKEKYLTKLASGEWSGTMCLTEPQCGTDLSQVKTKAEPLGDGRYKINGTKIWISAGDHDLTENIVHIVLARLPNAPAGTKGISLFVAPKYLIGADGKLDKSKRNVTCTALEKKMGIHGSATCVLSFEDTVGWLIGPEHAGLHAMFTFMNTARIGTAIQGLATCELAYQNSLPFAKERLAMRSLKGAQFPDKVADPIIVHPDVRRMMLTQKALAEGARAMCYDVSLKGANFFFILLWLTLFVKLTQCWPRRPKRSRSGSTLSWASSRPSSRAF
jgi:alkylation response protein AidB-like acyl-CoA dehydrogenase